MNVRVMIEPLVSRMQNEMSSGLNPLFSQLDIECSPGRVEQQIVKWLSISED